MHWWLLTDVDARSVRSDKTFASYQAHMFKTNEQGHVSKLVRQR